MLMPHKDKRTVYIVGLCVVCINVESVAQVHINFIANYILYKVGELTPGACCDFPVSSKTKGRLTSGQC